MGRISSDRHLRHRRGRSAARVAIAHAFAGSALLGLCGCSPVSSITVEPATLHLTVRTTAPLTAVVRGTWGFELPAEPVSWVSSDPAVAAVGATGIVDARGPGTAIISASAGGLSASCTVFVEALAFTRIEAGYAHSCGITPVGRVFCWGDNGVGQIGNGDEAHLLPTRLPTPVAGDVTYRALSAGWVHNCAITDAGGTQCWGENYQGQLGTVPRYNYHRQPVTVSTTVQLVHVSAGRWHTCALDASGDAYCWGMNSAGQLGLPGNLFVSLPARVPVLKFTALTARGDHTCGLTDDGRAYCWGSNTRGAVGDGSNSLHVHEPTAVAGNLSFRSLAAGAGCTCGVATDGTGWCWGLDGAGQLGDGAATLEHRTPVMVAGRLTFAELHPGLGTMTCGLTPEGDAYCWGRNLHGGLGDGMTEESPAPVPVAGVLRFRSLTVGGVHACGIAVTGLAYCWGSEYSTALGTAEDHADGLPHLVYGQR